MCYFESMKSDMALQTHTVDNEVLKFTSRGVASIAHASTEALLLGA